MKNVFDALRDPDPSGLHQELLDVGRGIAWGLVFGMPVLYTMEIWLGGREVSPLSLLGVLIGTIFLNIQVAYFAGMRAKNNRHSFRFALEDSITSMGLALVLSALILVSIGQVNTAMGAEAQVSKIVLEACLMSVGITFTNIKFKDVPRKKFEVTPASHRHHLMAAAGGAFIYSFSVAPTEEVILIASKLTSGGLIFLFFLELIFCYIVLHASGLKHRNFSMDATLEVFRTWTMAFLIAGLLLLCIGFGDLTFQDPLLFETTLVLTFPAIIGASAGRLVV